MSIGAISANPLLPLNLRPDAPAPDDSIWSNVAQTQENSSQPRPILPMGATMTLSFETIINLQAQEEAQTREELGPVKLEEPSAEEKFLEEARKSPIERMREHAMRELGVSEEDLANMSPEERRATEDKIRQLIEEKLREATGVDNAAAPAAEIIV